MARLPKLPPIAFGTWSWGQGGFSCGDRVFGRQLKPNDLRAIFEAGTAEGVSLWDTATVYGLGSSESALGELVPTAARIRVLLSTKFTPQIAPQGEHPLEAMLEASLKRLGTRYVDLYWVHHPHDVERWTSEAIPLLRDGRIRRLGLCNHNLAQIKAAEAILAREGLGVSAVQNHYSLLYRASEQAGILEYCRQRGVAFFAYLVLEQGALTDQYHPGRPLPADSSRGLTYNPLLPHLQPLKQAMAELGRHHGASVAQIAIAWARAKGTIPLVGVTGAAQVAEAVRACRIALTTADVLRLEGLAAQTGVNTRGSWEYPMVRNRPSA